MDRFTIIIIATIILIIWLLQYYYTRGFNSFVRIPIKQGAQILDGDVVRVKGIVQMPGRTLRAPLSGRSCVFYNIQVTQYWRRAHQADRKGYQIQETESGDLGILCEDNTWVVINTKNADNDIGNEFNDSYNFWSLDKDALNTFLHKHGNKYDPAVVLGERIETAEKVILAGDILWAAGKAEWREASELKFKLPTNKYLQIVAPEDGQVKIRNFEVY